MAKKNMADTGLNKLITIIKTALKGKSDTSHNHDSTYSKLGHTHNYLPLSGGTMNDDASIQLHSSHELIDGPSGNESDDITIQIGNNKILFKRDKYTSYDSRDTYNSTISIDGKSINIDGLNIETYQCSNNNRYEIYANRPLNIDISSLLIRGINLDDYIKRYGNISNIGYAIYDIDGTKYGAQHTQDYQYTQESYFYIDFVNGIRMLLLTGCLYKDSNFLTMSKDNSDFYEYNTSGEDNYRFIYINLPISFISNKYTIQINSQLSHRYQSSFLIHNMKYNNKFSITEYNAFNYNDLCWTDENPLSSISVICIGRWK